MIKQYEIKHPKIEVRYRSYSEWFPLKHFTLNCLLPSGSEQHEVLLVGSI